MKFELFVGVGLLTVILLICLLEFINRGSGRSYQFIAATETETPAPKRGDGRRD